jgi:hypothetical protein
LKEFTDFTNKTPDKLLKEAENEIKKGLLMLERYPKTFFRFQGIYLYVFVLLAAVTE